MRRKLIRLLLAAAVVVGSLITVGVGSTPVSAAHATCGFQQNYFTGMQTQNTGAADIKGVSAWFTDGGDYLCSSDTSLTNIVYSWTMVYNVANPSSQDWAQSGQEYYWGAPCNRLFAQQVKNYPSVAPSTVYGPCDYQPDAHLAWTFFDTGCSCEKMNIDNSTLAQTSYNPKTQWYSTVWQASWMGETHYQYSDIPGDATQKTHFWNMQTQNSGGGFPSISGATGLNLAGRADLSRYSIAGVSGDAIDVWTNTP